MADDNAGSDGRSNFNIKMIPMVEVPPLAGGPSIALSSFMGQAFGKKFHIGKYHFRILTIRDG